MQAYQTRSQPTFSVAPPLQDASLPWFPVRLVGLNMMNDVWMTFLMFPLNSELHCCEMNHTCFHGFAGCFKLEVNISKHESKNNKKNKHLSCGTPGRRWRNKQYQWNGFQSFLLDLEIEAGHVPSNTSSPNCASNICCRLHPLICVLCQTYPDMTVPQQGFPQGFKLYFSGMIPTNDQHFCSYHTT